MKLVIKNVLHGLSIVTFPAALAVCVLHYHYTVMMDVTVYSTSVPFEFCFFVLIEADHYW